MIDRESDALHEAGHAIVCIALGGIVRSVDIIRTATTAGTCYCVPPGDTVFQIAVYLAGALAVHEAAMRRGRKYTDGASSDLRDVATALGDKLGGCVRMDELPDFKAAEDLAKRTIGLSWGAISHLTTWLIRHDRASGELVAAIFQQHEQRGLERGKNFSMRRAG